LSEAIGTFTLRWLDITQSSWNEVMHIEGGGTIPLRAPGEGHWLALLMLDD